MGQSFDFFEGLESKGEGGGRCKVCVMYIGTHGLNVLKVLFNKISLDCLFVPPAIYVASARKFGVQRWRSRFARGR